MGPLQVSIEPGDSTLITSAPSQASTRPVIGPDQAVANSSTRIPASGARQVLDFELGTGRDAALIVRPPSTCRGVRLIRNRGPSIFLRWPCMSAYSQNRLAFRCSQART